MTMKLLDWCYFCICLVNKIKIFWLSIAIKWKVLLSETKLTVSDLELWGALGEKRDNFEFKLILSRASLGGKNHLQCTCEAFQFFISLGQVCINLGLVSEGDSRAGTYFLLFFPCRIFLLTFSLKLIHSWVFCELRESPVSSAACNMLQGWTTVCLHA